MPMTTSLTVHSNTVCTCVCVYVCVCVCVCVMQHLKQQLIEQPEVVHDRSPSKVSNSILPPSSPAREVVPPPLPPSKPAPELERDSVSGPFRHGLAPSLDEEAESEGKESLF